MPKTTLRVSLIFLSVESPEGIRRRVPHGGSHGGVKKVCESESESESSLRGTHVKSH